MTHPAYEVPRLVTPSATVVLASNPSPMTLEGTNTWILSGGRADGGCIVIDPGPEDDDDHLAAVARSAGKVGLIVLTHGHTDHSGGALRFAELTGAPIAAGDRALCRGAEPLGDDEVIELDGVRLRVWHTPGHTGDSLCLLLDGARPADAADSTEAAAADSPYAGVEAVLTGDTVLGRGTTVVAHPDGVLAHYLSSLERLAGLPPVVALPGHGPELGNIAEAAAHYLRHRQGRLDEVRAAVVELGPDPEPMDVVRRVYADVDQAVWPAAELSVRAQLLYLRDH